jgi:hypothetical protein|eukprot:COSAG01_NODE_3557_length_5939_cov_4.468151_5_plen_168_part_00
MQHYVRHSFRGGASLTDSRYIRAKIEDAQSQLDRMEELHNAREQREGGAVSTGRSSSRELPIQDHHNPAPPADTELAPNQRPGRGAQQSVAEPACWSASRVAHWLASETVGLGKHAGRFETFGVDGALLAVLDDEDLQELEVTSRLERKKLLIQISKLLQQPPAAAP